MGKLLQFSPRSAPVQSANAQELLETLRKRTTDDVRDLVRYYSSTGRWNDSCEPHVIRAIEELYIVCSKLAGAEHAEQPPSIG